MSKLLAFLLSSVPIAAFADDATASSDAASQYASFIPLLFIFGVFYFLVIRPQQKKNA